MATTKSTPRPKRKTPAKARGAAAADAVETTGGETGAPIDSGPTASPEGPAYGDDLRDAIARRAYEIFEREGRPEGRQEQHWRQAEAEIRAETSRTPAR